MAGALEDARASLARESDPDIRRRRHRHINGFVIPFYRVVTNGIVTVLCWAIAVASGDEPNHGLSVFFLGSVVLSVIQNRLSNRDARWAGEELMVADNVLYIALIVGTGGTGSFVFWVPLVRIVDMAGSRPALTRLFAVGSVFSVTAAYVIDGGLSVLLDQEILVRLALVVTTAMYLVQSRRVADLVWKRLRRSNERARFLIAEIDKKNLELAELAKTAERLAQAKGAFLATMSHEIRTPVNGIVGTSELLLDSRLDEDQTDLAQTIQVSANTLHVLINDILDHSKLEAGKMVMESVSVELATWVSESVNLVRRGCPKPGVAITTHIDPALPPFILGDPVRLRQVLLNLASNAVKFTEEGGVDVILTKQDDLLRLDVRDTGIGMSAEALKGLFTAFTQADVSTARRFGGTGLGLAISKRLVEAMGGKIAATSTPGVGSTFSALIPLRPADAPVQRPVESQTAVPDRFNLRVLIADDNAVNLKVGQRMLGKLGAKTEVAKDGREACEMVRQGNYDAVFMDVQMPQMSGLQATRTILQEHRNPPPIIGLSASASAEDRESCRQAGMVDFVAKPVRVDDLRQALIRLVARSDEVGGDWRVASDEPASAVQQDAHE